MREKNTQTSVRVYRLRVRGTKLCIRHVVAIRACVSLALVAGMVTHVPDGKSSKNLLHTRQRGKGSPVDDRTHSLGSPRYGCTTVSSLDTPSHIDRTIHAWHVYISV